MVYSLAYHCWRMDGTLKRPIVTYLERSQALERSGAVYQIAQAPHRGHIGCSARDGGVEHLRNDAAASNHPHVIQHLHRAHSDPRKHCLRVVAQSMIKSRAALQVIMPC